MRHDLRPASRSAAIALSLAVVLLLAAGCGSAESSAASGGPRTPSPEETMTSDLPTSPDPGALECGSAVGSTGGALTVTGHFPGSVAADEQTVPGVVTVTARRSEAHGVVTPQADVFLVREGRIVTLPMPQDAVGQSLELADGKVERMPAMATLVPCSGGGVLAPGTYDLYVRVVLNLDDGSRVDSLGGPWPLEVR